MGSINHLFGLLFSSHDYSCKLPIFLRFDLLLRSGGGVPTQTFSLDISHRMTRAAPHALPPLDTAYWSAASSTTAPPACVRWPPWPPRGAFCGSGAYTPVPTPHLLVPRSCPPAPE